MHLESNKLKKVSKFQPACCLSDKAFVSGAGGMGFKSHTCQVGHSVANGSVPPQHFFERSCVARDVRCRNDAKMGPANSLHASTKFSMYNEIFDSIKDSVLQRRIDFFGFSSKK